MKYKLLINICRCNINIYFLVKKQEQHPFDINSDCKLNNETHESIRALN